MVSVQSAKPDPRLAPFLQWYVQREFPVGDAEVIEPVVARSGTMLEFQFDALYDVQPYGIVVGSSTTAPITVIGPMSSRSVRLHIRGHIEALMLLFRPLGFFRLFGVPVSPLAGIGSEGHGILGQQISTLYQQLGNTAGFTDRVDMLNRFLLDRLAKYPPIGRNGQALRMLASAKHATSVAEAARLAGISTRQLERISLEYAGVSPKMLARLGRFQNALRMKKTRDLSWMEVAHATDHHDQMHLIHEFHALGGDSPGRVMEQMAPEHLISFLCR